jgi:FSR family fosmidomycin resistance protein-like MFS transporter
MAATITTEVSSASARLTLGVCCVGHTFSHIFQPVFYVTALVLESELGLSHGGVIGLIVAANVLYGVAAPVAGWLGDRWSTTGMLLLFFTGTGTGMMLTGFAVTPLQIAVCLTLTGLFASIFHPVGFSWLVRSSLNRGTALGIVGVFGGLGPSVAALTAGVLVDTMSWRAAFIIPGAVVIMIGVAFSVLLARGMVVDRKEDLRPDPLASRGDRVRTILVLLVTVICTGIIYHATQAAIPKVFSERIDAAGSNGLFGLSALVAAIYLVAGGIQVLSGYLSDRYSLKAVYVLTFIFQVPFLVLAASLDGPVLMVVAVIMVCGNVAAFPPENSLIARYTPPHWRGVAYGLKFVFMFGVGGVGVMMEGALYDFTGGFYWLFVVLAAMAAVAFVAAIGLPGETSKAAAD